MFLPNSNSCAEKPVLACFVLFITKETIGKCRSHEEYFDGSSMAVMMVLIFLLNDSTLPCVVGEYGCPFLEVILNDLIKA